MHMMALMTRATKREKGGMQFLEQEDEKKWLVSTPVLRTEAECKAVCRSEMGYVFESRW